MRPRTLRCRDSAHPKFGTVAQCSTSKKGRETRFQVSSFISAPEIGMVAQPRFEKKSCVGDEFETMSPVSCGLGPLAQERLSAESSRQEI
jgi:hypothetical protein